MIEKYIDGPHVTACEPAFSTEHLDAYLLRAPKGFDADTHLAVLDTYIFYERGEEYYTPACAIYAEQRQFGDGRVLNCISNCDVGPFGALPSGIAESLHSDPAYREEFKSKIVRDTTDCLFGIQEFAGPVTLAHMDIPGFQEKLGSERIYYDLNDQLLLAVAAGTQQRGSEAQPVTGGPFACGG
jgi:hypothetical protein